MFDLQDVDPEFFRSMMWLRENPVDSTLGMTFVVTEEEDGEVGSEVFQAALFPLSIE